MEKLTIKDRINVDGNYLLVVAIDFGTTFSGYAFSFQSDPNNIKMNKSWGAEVGFQSYKTSTTVLTAPGGAFKAFGYDAEQEYSNLEAEDTTSDKYNLYQKFKMKLHGKGVVGQKVLLHSTNGNIRPGIDIFAMALQYMKGHVIEAISLQLASRPTVDDIRWVLTVPAIWGDTSKRFMREAAFKAGLIRSVDSTQLLIALEPEAASLYCRTLEMKNFVGMESEKGLLKLKTGTKYMIIDAGGGTIDITVHETQEDGTVRELHAANGGPWGGSFVDENYEQLLVDIFGEDFINGFKCKFPNQWLLMILDFEKRKRVSRSDSTKATNMPFTMQFAMEYKSFSGEDLPMAFDKKLEIGAKFSSGMICISPSKMKELFECVVGKIKDHLIKLLRENIMSDVKHIFLVGGFGESNHLQEMIRFKFGAGRKILIPEEASMCVLKGAVLYGHNPKAISTRVSQFTYAIGTTRPFVEGKDDDRNKIKCKNGNFAMFLLPLVQIGDNLPIGTIRDTTIFPMSAEQKHIYIDLYSGSEIIKTEDIHPTDTRYTKLADVTIGSPDITKGIDREIKVSIIFGGTEIIFKALDVETKREAKVQLNFNI